MHAAVCRKGDQLCCKSSCAFLCEEKQSHLQIPVSAHMGSLGGLRCYQPAELAAVMYSMRLCSMHWAQL
jgi:hypothetical protein